MSELKERRFIVIGTSGSTDYLRDTTSDRRYWPVAVPVVGADPPEGDAGLTSGMWVGDGKADEVCDGLHDEGAPPQYLCSRCYPDLRAVPAEHEAVVLQDEQDEE